MEYLRSLVGAAALLSVAKAFAPMREGVRRAVLSGLSVLFLLLLLPKDISFDLSFLEEYVPEASESVQEVYTDAWREGIEKGICADLCARYSLGEKEITVAGAIERTDEEVRITHLSVTVAARSFGDADGMVRYIEEAYGCPCEIHFRAAVP